MPTLVLSPRYTDDSKTLRAAAGRAGWKTERLGGWRAPAHLRGEDVVLYGEPTFVEVIAARLGLALIDAPQDWLLHLPERHRRRAVNESTLAETRRLFSAPAFVKPADGRKAFEGKVYDSAADLPGALPADTEVFVAEPVTWEIEFRCFVLEGEVVTMSPYLRDGELALTGDGRWDASDEDVRAARDYAAELLADPLVRVPPAVVIDVGRVRDRGWAVVEANAAWGAGLYGCPPETVLPVLARSCSPRPPDAEWTVTPVQLTE
ncbi:ATP-grasp domain-containing protein [Spirillospora sp. NPDC048911]|uniref:ATP-grasp domain-containing protein n=1 Tax=Spirillospora sp. NPDC048911 TaxID=3364527 RepID=UPI0037240161